MRAGLRVMQRLPAADRAEIVSICTGVSEMLTRVAVPRHGG